MWQKMRWEERVMGVGDKKTGDSREASSGKAEKTERSFLHLRRPPTQLTFFSAAISAQSLQSVVSLEGQVICLYRCKLTLNVRLKLLLTLRARYPGAIRWLREVNGRWVEPAIKAS